MRARIVCALLSVALGACAPGPPPPGAWVVDGATAPGPAPPVPSTPALTRDPEDLRQGIGVRVRDQGAVVVDGVRIEVTTLSAKNTLSRTVLELASPDGVFLLPDAEVALTELVVRRPGAATFRWSPGGCGSDGLRRSERDGLRVLEVDLEPEAQLTGRLVDTHGIPLLGGTVSIDGTRLLVDAVGQFRIAGLASDEHSMIVDTSDPRLVPRARFRVRAPGHVELVVDRAGELVVHVDRPRRGESRSVLCLLKEDTPAARLVQQVDGRAGEPARLAGLRPGRYVVEVQGPGLVPQRSLPFEVVAGGALQVRFHAASRLLRARPVRPDGTRLATVVRYTTAEGIEVTKRFGALVILPVPREVVRVRVSSAAGPGLDVVVDLPAGGADVDVGELRLGLASS